ncbi:MAG: hypothetical protein Q9218_004341 [Villophora microphyllina]
MGTVPLEDPLCSDDPATCHIHGNVDYPVWNNIIIPEWNSSFYGTKQYFADGFGGTFPGKRGEVLNLDSAFGKVVYCVYELYVGHRVYNDCWTTLKLGAWLSYWTLVHDLNSPTRPPNHGYSSNFSVDFLEFYDYAQDCSSIQVDTCTPPTRVGAASPSYIALNIYGVNQWFNSWYTALGNAEISTSNNIDTIVQLLDPPKQEFVTLQDVTLALTTLSASLGPFTDLDGDLEAAVESVNAVKAFSDVLNTALELESTIKDLLYPTGGDPSTELFQIADLKKDLPLAIEAAKGNIDSTLRGVLSNYTLFLAFANQSRFSTNQPGIHGQNNYLWYTLNTYIISRALNGNNVYGVLAPDTNPRVLAINGTILNYGLDDCLPYDSIHTTGPFWYNNVTNSAYGLNNFGDMGKSYGDVLRTLLSTYTTGELLFEFARTCDALHNYMIPFNLTLNANGFAAPCVSQLRIVSWDMGCTDRYGIPRRDCEFAEPEVHPQNGFLRSTTKGNLFTFNLPEDETYQVPNCYLGPLLTQTRYKLTR